MMEALEEERPASAISLVTEESIVKELRTMLPLMNANTATLKIVMQKLASRFGMNFADIKAQWRPRIKAVLPGLLGLCQSGEGGNENASAETSNGDEDDADSKPSRRRAVNKRNAVVDASDEEDEYANSSDTGGGYLDGSEDKSLSDEEEHVLDSDISEGNELSLGKGGAQRRTMSHRKKRKGTESALPTKKSKTAEHPDQTGLASLKELGRAAGALNPQVYKHLKSAKSTEEAENFLRERLDQAGISFHGLYPTCRDISAAKKKHAREKELEGIDTSLIISDSRPRRGGVRHISYKEDPISGEEDADHDDAEDDFEEKFTASDSESSEATF
ncbi:putative HIRA-interacting protein [Plasmopara halstedii]